MTLLYCWQKQIRVDGVSPGKGGWERVPGPQVPRGQPDLPRPGSVYPGTGTFLAADTGSWQWLTLGFPLEA